MVEAPARAVCGRPKRPWVVVQLLLRKLLVHQTRVTHRCPGLPRWSQTADMNCPRFHSGTSLVLLAFVSSVLGVVLGAPCKARSRPELHAGELGICHPQR